QAEEAICRFPSQTEQAEAVSTEVASTEVTASEATNTIKDFDLSMKTNQWHDMYPDATEVQQLETRFTPGTSAYEGLVTAAETEGMLSRFKTFGNMAKAGGAALGPVFDAVMLGVWTDKMYTTFHAKESTTLDKVSASLMLVPIVGDTARALAEVDHFNTKVETERDTLAAESTYIYKDLDEESLKQAAKINQMLHSYDMYLRQTYERIQLITHKQAVVANGKFQAFSLALLDNLEHTLNRVDTVYFKHFYYNLYRTPYALSEQTQLAMSPLACQADVLNYQALIDQVDRPKMEAMLATLNGCLNQVISQGLSPIDDLLLGRHPNITLALWNEQGHDLVNTKIRMIQNTKNKLTQNLADYRDYYTRTTQEELRTAFQSLSPVVNKKAAELFPMVLKHWAHTSFPDIDESRISLNFDNFESADLTLTTPKTCNPLLKHLPICSFTQFVSDAPNNKRTIKFDPSKSPYLTQFKQSTDSIDSASNNLIQPETLQNIFQNPVNTEIPAYPFHNYINAFLHLSGKYELAADSLDILSDAKISSLHSNDMPLSEDEAIKAQAQQDTDAYLILQAFKKDAPLLYKRLHTLTLKIGSDQINESNLFAGLFQYPFNQKWYVERHDDELGNFVQFFLTNSLQATDANKQVDFAFTDKIQLPRKMEQLIDPVNQALYQQNAALNSADIARDQTKLAAILSSAESNESKLIQNCARYDDNLQRLSDVKNQTLSYLPFWYPIVSDWHRVYAQYHYIMMPLCRALQDSAQPAQPSQP
ncbi:MAG: hypothetical protein ISP86_01775, partial [Shewanellaceae bacterium]|nr:hypothetical protein [Shewanellaceae bacterium]